MLLECLAHKRSASVSPCKLVNLVQYDDLTLADALSVVFGDSSIAVVLDGLPDALQADKTVHQSFDHDGGILCLPVRKGRSIGEVCQTQ